MALAEGKLVALIEEGGVKGVLAENKAVCVEGVWESSEEPADIGMADPDGADDMVGNDERERNVATVKEGFDRESVSTLGNGIEKKMTPVEVSCDERELGVLVGRLENSSCVASAELIEESAPAMTSAALEGVLVGV
jgi:hypothetical protein